MESIKKKIKQQQRKHELKWKKGHHVDFNKDAAITYKFLLTKIEHHPEKVRYVLADICLEDSIADPVFEYISDIVRRHFDDIETFNGENTNTDISF